VTTTTFAIVAATTCLLGASSLAEDKVIFESGEAPATLLELFTSEGCSSCPVADLWISRLRTSGELWKSIVPVAYHVDYWDRLGWRDRFARREFTARQNRYAAEWGSGSVYTPAFVRNGREWRGWSDSGTVPRATGAPAGVLRVSLDGTHHASVTFAPSAAPVEQTLQVRLALLGMNLESKVARGENSGRKLHHDFVVLETAASKLQRSGDHYSAELTLPNEQSADQPGALAVWVTSGDSPAPIQATGGWLKPNES
jgi:hypothetical protein